MNAPAAGDARQGDGQPVDGQRIDGQRADGQEDRWMPAMLTLARELWVMRDRQRVLEQLLAERGVVAAGAIDAWQPDAAQQSAIDAECRRFVQSLVMAPGGAEPGARGAG